MSPGFDRERFAAHVDDEFICAICICVLRRPLQLPCEHLFCESCIRHWLELNSACPACRQLVACVEDCRTPPRALMSLLHKFPIRCKNVDYGCGELLTVAEIEKHESSCLFEAVKCPVEGCCLLVPRNNLAKHVTSCPSRSKVCPSCELEFMDGTTSHTKDDCIQQLKRTVRQMTDLLVAGVKQQLLPPGISPKDREEEQAIIDSNENIPINEASNEDDGSVISWDGVLNLQQGSLNRSDSVDDPEEQALATPVSGNSSFHSTIHNDADLSQPVSEHGMLITEHNEEDETSCDELSDDAFSAPSPAVVDGDNERYFLPHVDPVFSVVSDRDNTDQFFEQLGRPKRRRPSFPPFNFSNYE